MPLGEAAFALERKEMQCSALGYLITAVVVSKQHSKVFPL